jgi:CRP-like cAMP-binding protein
MVHLAIATRGDCHDVRRKLSDREPSDCTLPHTRLDRVRWRTEIGARRADSALVSDHHHNLLLRGLSPETLHALTAGEKPVALRCGEVICEAGRGIGRVWFPLQGAISLFLPVAKQSRIEVGLIGREGMVAVASILGMTVSLLRGVVQIPGSAWSLDAKRFGALLEVNPELRTQLNRYVHVRMQQLAQSTACKSFHVIEGRLVRWLLMSRDRSRGDELALTHENLAQVLGVRRAGISLAAASLQERRLIEYSRGHIVLLDRHGLEAAACSCYASEKRLYARIMR